MSEMQKGEAAKRYTSLTKDRDEFLKRANLLAGLTIPSLMTGVDKAARKSRRNQALKQPYQSLGARGVTNLASKLLLTLFPAGLPFYRLEVDQKAVPEWAALSENERADIRTKLSSLEHRGKDEVDAEGMRVPLFLVLKLLLVTGNVCLFMPKDRPGIRTYRLDQYVTRRDPEGTLLELVTEEEVSPETLEADVLSACMVDTANMKPEDNLMLYTHVKRVDGKLEWYQELNGHEVPDSKGHSPVDAPAWLALRFIGMPDEDYGRAFVEEYMGDLISLNSSYRSVIRAGAKAAKTLTFVNPNGSTSAETLKSAKDDQVVHGNANDITQLRFEKIADFSFVLKVIERIENRLERAFLLQSSVQRKGERVTAEEIRYIAGELEDSLGGVYSTLSQELQLPLSKRLMLRMEAAGRVPKLPKGTLRTMIITGLDALGRSNDMARLDELISRVGEVESNPALSKRLDIDAYIKRLEAALGVSAKGIFISEEDVSQSEQTGMAAGVVAEAAPDIIKTAANQMMQGEMDGT